jgi:hypothetical protein
MTAIDVNEANPNGAAEAPAPPPPPRARLVTATVQLQIVADDGETLHPLQIAPIQVAASEWPTFDLNAQVADVQRQLDQGVR